MKHVAIAFAVVVSWCTNASAGNPTSSAGEQLAAQVLSQGINSLDPKDIMAWIDMPRTAKRNQRITLTITVENARVDGEFTIESIDLGGNLGEGFSVGSVRPAPSSIDPFLAELTLEYPLTIAAGAQAKFEIELVAISAGVFIGDVDIWEGDKFLTRVAQCRVTE